MRHSDAYAHTACACAAESRPGETPTSSLDSASISVGHVFKDPRSRKGTPLRHQTGNAHSANATTSSAPSGAPSGPNSVQEASSRTLANAAFDNSRGSSSFAAQTPLVTMHSALNEADMHTSTGTMDSALAAAAMEQRPPSSGRPPTPVPGSPTSAALALASAGAVEPSPRGGGDSVPHAEFRKQGSFGAGSDKASSSLKRVSDGTKSPPTYDTTYDTPEGSPVFFALDGPSRSADGGGPALPIFGQASTPAGEELDTLADETSELSTEFVGIAASMSAAGGAGSAVQTVGVDAAAAAAARGVHAGAGVGIDGINSKGGGGVSMLRRGSTEEKSGDVSLSLQCPQVIREGVGQKAAADGQQRTLSDAERWSFEDLPKVHGDVEDSGTLEPDHKAGVPGRSPPGQARNGHSARDAPAESISLHSTCLEKSNGKKATEAESIVVPTRAMDAVKRDPNRRKKTLQFRMDGDLGLMSCVRVLFAASKDARGLISEDMVRVLLDHGVLKQRDMVTIQH